MRLPYTLLALTALSPSILAGQARYSAGFSLVTGTRLVKDRIFQDITVNQLPSPTFTLAASVPASDRERVSLEVSLGFTKTRVRESGFPEIVGPAFKTLGITAGVEGPIIGALHYRGGAGLIKYLPDKVGIFRQGGPTLLLLTMGADYRLPVNLGVGLVARLRYDYQRFSTDEMRFLGFGRTEDVHRVGLGLAVEYAP
jgi:hypothetical protein